MTARAAILLAVTLGGGYWLLVKATGPRRLIAGLPTPAGVVNKTAPGSVGGVMPSVPDMPGAGGFEWPDMRNALPDWISNYFSGGVSPAAFGGGGDSMRSNFSSAYATAGAPYRQALQASEVANGMPQDLLARVAYRESRFRPEIINGTVKSSAGAMGIMQFMPATAAWLGVNPLNPAQAISAAGRYLRTLYNKFNSWPLAVAAYNWGEGNLARYLRGDINPKTGQIYVIPRETIYYVAEINGADIVALANAARGTLV